MQAIYDIAQLCSLKGIQHAVLSPGSRCAPLTISFARQKNILNYIVPDERSAAFIGLGLSRITQKATVLICTSGSAAYNYAPAIAEAYFQHVPLLVLTADRPPEWIDQLDGQTIRQNAIYGNHVKASYTLPVDTDHPDAAWHVQRIVNEAINTAEQYPKGPVHINVPLREPFYPKSEFSFSSSIKIIDSIASNKTPDAKTVLELQKEIAAYKNILIVAGQSISDKRTTELLGSIDAPVVTDVISNHFFKGSIQHHDAILTTVSTEKANQLRPDLLITFGNSIISKNFKTFLRQHKPKAHWHIQEAGQVADTFQSLTKTIQASPFYFFDTVKKHIASTVYKESWLKLNAAYQKTVHEFIQNEKVFSEFQVVAIMMAKLPENSILHLANSMPVRYANYLGLTQHSVEVVANRGTSGIDGVISTAYGTALTTDKLVFVLTGDMSFLYDRNAFWNNHLPSNLRILILNNHGGGIFRMINGPSSQPEGEEYFVTRQALTAENTMKDFDVDYLAASDRESFEKALEQFLNPKGKSKLLEVQTDGIQNTEVWNRLKSILN